MKYDKLGNSQKGYINPYLLGALGIGGLILLVLQPFGWKRIPATEIGLKVNQFGNEETRGAENAQVVEGTVVYNKYTEEVITIPRRRQEYQFTNNNDRYSSLAEDVSFSASGSTIREEVGVELVFLPDQLPSYYGTYGLKPLDFIRQNFYTGLKGCYTSAGEGIIPSDYQTQRTAVAENVRSCLNARFPQINVISIDLLDDPVYEKNIQDSINNQFKAQQEAQQAKSELEKVEAQARADVAQAEATAKVNLIEAENEAAVQQALSDTVTDELIQLRRLEIDRILAEAEKTRAENWNGQEVGTVIQAPNVQVGASNGN